MDAEAHTSRQGCTRPFQPEAAACTLVAEREGRWVLRARPRTRVLLAAALQALELPLRRSQHLGRRVGLLRKRAPQNSAPWMPRQGRLEASQKQCSATRPPRPSQQTVSPQSPTDRVSTKQEVPDAACPALPTLSFCMSAASSCLPLSSSSSSSSPARPGRRRPPRPAPGCPPPRLLRPLAAAAFSATSSICPRRSTTSCGAGAEAGHLGRRRNCVPGRICMGGVVGGGERPGSLGTAGMPAGTLRAGGCPPAGEQ